MQGGGDAKSGLGRLEHFVGLLVLAASVGCGDAERSNQLDRSGAAGADEESAGNHADGAGLGGVATLDGAGGFVGGVAGLAGAGGSEGEIGEVRVIRGDPEQPAWWDLTIRGVALEQESKIVTVRVGDPQRPPERLGSGQARIVEGGFELSLPQVWESQSYKTKLAFIDANGNGRCDPELDPVFRDDRASPYFVLTLQNGPPSLLDMPESSAPGEDCSVFNNPWPTDE